MCTSPFTCFSRSPSITLSGHEIHSLFPLPPHLNLVTPPAILNSGRDFGKYLLSVSNHASARKKPKPLQQKYRHGVSVVSDVAQPEPIVGHVSIGRLPWVQGDVGGRDSHTFLHSRGGHTLHSVSQHLTMVQPHVHHLLPPTAEHEAWNGANPCRKTMAKSTAQGIRVHIPLCLENIPGYCRVDPGRSLV